MRNIFINLEKEAFRGNVLDITWDGRGIIYNINKFYDQDIEIDYLENKFSEDENDNYYDSCVMFFSLRNYVTQLSRNQLFKKLHGILNEGGHIYIWDINKERGKPWNGKIKISLPDKALVDFKVNNLNLIEESTPDKLIKSMKEYFEIVTKVESDNCFKIVARRKDD